MVLIKSMELPKSCGHCSLKDYRFCSCCVNGKRIPTWGMMAAVNERPTWCPLTEVEPYGPEGTLYKEKSDA